MPEILLGARDEEPSVCGICSRISSTVGVIHPIGQHVLWLCELCTPKNGIKVADMNPVKLEELEQKAIDTASAATVEPLLAAILKVLWESGIRDLDALDEKTYSDILEKVTTAPDFVSTQRKMLIDYTLAVRAAVTNASSTEKEGVPF